MESSSMKADPVKTKPAGASRASLLPQASTRWKSLSNTTACPASVEDGACDRLENRRPRFPQTPGRNLRPRPRRECCVPVAASVDARVGGRLQVGLSDDAGHEVSVQWDQPLQAGVKVPAQRAAFPRAIWPHGRFPVRADARRRASISGDGAPKSGLNDLRSSTSGRKAPGVTRRRHPRNNRRPGRNFKFQI